MHFLTAAALLLSNTRGVWELQFLDHERPGKEMGQKVVDAFDVDYIFFILGQGLGTLEHTDFQDPLSVQEYQHDEINDNHECHTNDVYFK